MAKLLIKTGGASFAETDGMMQRLNEHHIACYETHAGFWRLGVDALWVVDSDNFLAARELIADYQESFHREAREQHLLAKQAGQAPTFWGQLWRQPVKVTLTLLAVIIIVAITLLPFFFL